MIFYCAKVFSLLQHSFQFSSGKDLQNENADRTAHSSPCFPVNTQWHQGRYWYNRKRNDQEKMFKSSAILCLAICLCATEHATFSPTQITWPHQLCGAGSHISDNPGSYKELCSHIRTSEIKAAQRWTPPTSYLGGYYSQTDPCHLLRATCLASVVYWNFLRRHTVLAMSKSIAIIFFSWFCTMSSNNRMFVSDLKDSEL